MDVTFFEDNADRAQVLDVLTQLRPHFSQDALAAQIKRQQQSGYQLAYVKSDNIVLAVVGFEVRESLAWGKHIYIDDLVTNENHRSQGVGKVLMAWLKHHAAEHGCKQIHVDSEIQRFKAHIFYQREEFKTIAHHFVWA
ncbi:GNAT family N-acetyltransferase [Enterovibrio norvegicus]|uniref:GNAT family N-acetyltransferase n=1 Tax=Enterovibrio norvegicus TaxID=188144 RepID=A0A2N7L774_9GAMM|nr:GNAT family N-acetyltransferase [Enterovibrio norvegicus]PML78760.1 GNAT family N-acetyltransferase [Enterovibrio norvegicus]PMN89824.1 GNAT family N-acetyltransferase [Enterovibrio norvegicus]